MSTFNSLALLFSFCIVSSLSAQINLDSLNTLLPSSIGTERANLLNTIAWEVKFSDPEQAFKLSRESLHLSQSIGYIKGEATSHYQIAAFYYLQGNFSKSLETSQKSITLFEDIDNSKGLAKNWNLNGMNLHRLKKHSEAMKYYEKAISTCQLFKYDKLIQKVRANMANVAYQIGDYENALNEYSLIASFWLENKDSSYYYNVLTNIAKSQQKLGKYSEALSNYFKIEAFEKANNRKRYLANNYNDIGELYLKLGFYEQTIEMFKTAAQLYEEIGNRRKVGIEYENLGILYLDNEEFEKAEYFYNRALHIYDSLGLNNTGRIYNNIAVLKIKTKQFDEALSLLKESLKTNQDIEDKWMLTKNHCNMGVVFFEKKQIQKAEEHYLKAIDLSSETGAIFDKQIASEGLAKIYKLSNNDKAYQKYASISKSAQDSLFKDTKVLEINKLLVNNLYEKHRNKTEELNQELAATKAELALLENKNSYFFQRNAVPIISFFTFLSLGLIWLIKKQKQTAQLNKTLKNKSIEDQEKFETSLKSKNKQLTLLSLESAQKTDLFKKILDSLQQIIIKNPDYPEIKRLEQILSNHSMDQHNWENFTTYFNEVYIGFFDRLSKAFPTITNKELRLCALIRLKIPSYEASIILGISQSSVHTTRYRIRKKMGLAADVNIDEFIYSI